MGNNLLLVLNLGVFTQSGHYAEVARLNLKVSFLGEVICANVALLMQYLHAAIEH